jgi:hypothetical protein
MTTVFPTPAPLNAPALPPLRSITLIPVASKGRRRILCKRRGWTMDWLFGV